MILAEPRASAMGGPRGPETGCYPSAVRVLLALLLLLLPAPLLLAQEKGVVTVANLPGPGGKRTVYAVYKARTAKAEGKLPLILALHGGGDTAHRFAGFLYSTAELQGGILVCAQGLRPVKGTEGYWWKGDAEEEAMLDGLLDHVRETMPVDRAKLTVIGLADGAELAIRWSVEKDRGVKGVIALNFLWKPPGPPKAPKGLKFCLIACKEAMEEKKSLVEHAQKAAKAIEGAGFPVVLRIVPGKSRSFFHGWENEFSKALSWFDGRLDWPKQLAEKAK